MPLTDNTAQWGVRRLTKFQDNNGIPVGFEYFSTNPNIPTGSLPLFGGEYSRTTYADLWSWVQEQAGYLLTEEEWQAKASANEGNVPYYSSGDGSTTFRVPSLMCWVRGANGIEEVGSYLSAGLPNITGQIQYGGVTGLFYGPNDAVGAFKSEDDDKKSNGLETRSGTSYGAKFNASYCSSIYGNSDTVQPKSIVGMWLVKAYGTVTNVGSTDVSAIAQGLTELETRASEHANKDLSNLSEEGKVAFSPNYAGAISVNRVDNKVNFTAPSCGYLIGSFFSQDELYVNGVAIGFTQAFTGWDTCPTCVPLSKGDVITGVLNTDYWSNVKFVPFKVV